MLTHRYDGRRLRSLNAFYQITPYIMRTRVDAHDYFEDSIDVGEVETWLRAHPGLRFLHFFVAAYVRTVSQKPRLNRFVAGRRIYARNEILVSLAIKKKLDEDSPEMVVKLKFNPTDTIYDVARVIDSAVSESRASQTKNEADKTARLFMLCPGFVVRFLVWALRTLDAFGKLPKAIHRASPFHTSAFVTDLASLGIKPIYHHLYDFGTTSVFLAFGIKEQERTLDAEGKLVVRDRVGLKVVNDERICDGYYYASAFKYLMSLYRNPEVLAEPPASVVQDEE